MKKLFALLLFFPSAAFADIKQEFVTSAQITVDMPYVVTKGISTVICAEVTNSCFMSANAAVGKNKNKANSFFI